MSSNDWFRTTCERIEVHGLSWYSKSNSKITQICVMVFASLVFIWLPIWTSVQFYEYLALQQVQTMTTTHTATMVKYPKLTLCHAKYFDNSYLKGMFSRGDYFGH